jgi:GTP cyclohydrolase I
MLTTKDLMEAENNISVGSVSAQPSYRCSRIANMRKFASGRLQAQERLTELNFDPMTQLVATHQELLNEIEMMRNLREREIEQGIFGDKKEGSRFSQFYYQSLFDKITNIEKELLRYGYSRVPETMNIREEKDLPIVIQLSGQDEEEAEIVED